MITFNLDAHESKTGERPIRVCLCVNGQRLMTSIGYSISPDKWNGNGVVAGTKANPTRNSKGIPAATINARIAAITSAFANLEATPGASTMEDYRAALNKITGKASGQTTKATDALPELLRYFDMFTAEESAKQQWTAGTLECIHACRQHLQHYKENLTFADFNEKGLDKYIAYLRAGGYNIAKARAEAKKEAAEAALKAATDNTTAKAAKAALKAAELAVTKAEAAGISEKTAQKHFIQLKWFLNWAIRKGYCPETAITRYKAKFKITAQPVIFLTRQELLKLYNYEIPTNGAEVELTDYNGNKYTKVVEDAGGLAKTRDLFCFCAFTSLRYSDMAALKRSNISNDAIAITTQKTHDRLEIPLNNYSRAILQKYEGYRDAKGLALPVIANQNMNYYLKHLCELCGFNDPISKTYYRAGQRVEETAPKWALIGTHAARRTFICYALTIGIPPQVVMKFTGHSDYSAMKPYIDIAGADAAKAMQLMND